jgi:uroporphyrinogen decarboxylase
LFYFAVKGSHKQDLSDARKGLQDGRYDGFCELLLDFLAGVMAMQASAGADAMAVFDTCAGDLTPEVYRDKAVPVIDGLLQRFKALCPNTPVIYYSKGTSYEHWDSLKGLPIDCLGVDSNHDIGQVLRRYADRWSIQGNFNQELLQSCSSSELKTHLDKFFGAVKELPPSLRKGWICGLGHGILPKTPEDNVRQFIAAERGVFA